MYLLPLDHVSKNQLSTSQNLLNIHTNLGNGHWISIIPLDTYRLAKCEDTCCACTFPEDKSFIDFDNKTCIFISHNTDMINFIIDNREICFGRAVSNNEKVAKQLFSVALKSGIPFKENNLVEVLIFKELELVF